jgi:hypothetical protein
MNMNSETNKIWFYGDSWTVGAELAGTQNNYNLENAYPSIINKKTGIATVNKGIEGSSQTRLIYQLSDSDTLPGDIAVFALTAKTRRMYMTDKNAIKEVQFSFNDLIVNHHEDHCVSSRTLSLLYYMCKRREIKCYFFNLFDTYWLSDKLFNEVPEECWLMPPSESVLSWLFDTTFFHRFKEHHNGDFREWLDRNCDLVKKYIRPCEAHPNLHGQETIADFLIEKLKL